MWLSLVEMCRVVCVCVWTLLAIRNRPLSDSWRSCSSGVFVRAYLEACRSSGFHGPWGVHLVQGPPGTGKTKTTVCALRILQRSDSA